MAAANVKLSYITGAKGICDKCIEELNTQAASLRADYQNAGSTGWADEKYVQLGTIIEDCATALLKPIADLENCKNVLERLYQVVLRYEEQHLS